MPDFLEQKIESQRRSIKRSEGWGAFLAIASLGLGIWSIVIVFGLLGQVPLTDFLIIGGAFAAYALSNASTRGVQAAKVELDDLLARQWQPIETAPLSGIIELRRSEGERIVFQRWAEKKPFSDDDAGWRDPENNVKVEGATEWRVGHRWSSER